MDFAKERLKLIEILQQQGISNTDVLNAIASVPRHLFVPKNKQRFAYYNKPMPIGYGQTISQPYTVAFMTELLEVEQGDKILEIGTGSGYQASILAELDADVYTIERITELYQRTKKLLENLGYTNKIKIFHADGAKGLPQFAPFDKIIITAATEHIPPQLKQQLKIGGYIVAPVGIPNHYQNMLRIIKIDQNIFQSQNFGNFVFVPLKKGIE